MKLKIDPRFGLFVSSDKPDGFIVEEGAISLENKKEQGRYVYNDGAGGDVGVKIYPMFTIDGRRLKVWYET